MSISRTTILKGPAFLTYASDSFHSEGDIKVERVEKWGNKTTSGFATIGRPLLDRRIVVTFTPSMWANTGVLFPYGSTQPGDVLYGGSDSPMVITPRNGRPLTILNCAITKLPSLTLAVDKPTFSGAVEFTGLVGNNLDPSAIASYYTQGAVGTGVALTGFIGADVLRSRYLATYNSVTLRTEKGWKIDFALSLDEDHPDGEVTINMRMKELEASAQAEITGLTESAYDALLNNALDVGSEPTPYDLAIAGITSSGAPAVTIKNAFIEAMSGYTYGPTATRINALKFTTIRTTSSNVLTSLHTIGVS